MVSPTSTAVQVLVLFVLIVWWIYSFVDAVRVMFTQFLGLIVVSLCIRFAYLWNPSIPFVTTTVDWTKWVLRIVFIALTESIGRACQFLSDKLCDS